MPTLNQPPSAVLPTRDEEKKNEQAKQERIGKGESFAKMRLRMEANVYDEDGEKLDALVDALIYILNDISNGEIPANREKIRSAARYLESMTESGRERVVQAVDSLAGYRNSSILENLLALYNVNKEYDKAHDPKAEEELKAKSSAMRELLEALFEGIEAKG